MKKLCIALSLMLAASCAFAHSGVLKGAASDAAFLGKKAAYPVRHPKKSAHGAFKGFKAVAKTAVSL